MNEILVGADPELFLVDVNGKFISSIGKIGGSKEKPLAIGNGCAIQEDNVAVEFNIKPASQVTEFRESIEYALGELTRRAAEQNLLLNISASKSFDEDQLMHRRARRFGCDPDFNAWTGLDNDAQHSEDPNLRSCGGHVHIGCSDSLNKKQLARWCDVKLGLYSVLEDETEGSARRREIYGKAGAFRPKIYGIEYRTLSNYWLSTQKFMTCIFWRAKIATKMVEEGNVLSDDDGVVIQDAINNGNKELAKKLIQKYGGVIK